MVRKLSECRVEKRVAPRGGKGEITLYHLLESNEYYNKGRLMSKAILPSGSLMGYHTHDRETEVIFILAGMALVNDNGVEKTMSAGDILITGNGDGHSIESVGQIDLEYMAIIITQEDYA